MVVHIILIVKKKSEIPKLVHSVINVSGNSPETARFCLIGIWTLATQQPSPLLNSIPESFGELLFLLGNILGKWSVRVPFLPLWMREGPCRLFPPDPFTLQPGGTRGQHLM